MIFLLAAGIIWWWVGRTKAVNPLFLPPPEAVWTSLLALIRTNAFWASAGVTLRTIAEAYAICAILGLAIGYAVTRSKLVTEAVEPVISSLFAIPITLFFPIFILFFGIGPNSKVAYAACYGVFPIAINAIAGLSRIDEHYLRAARSMGFSRLGVFRHLLLPAALPVMLTGLRIGFFICFASVLGGETISSIVGVGHNIALQAELMEPARMYAWIAVVVVVSVSLNFFLSLFDEKRGEA